MERKFQVFESSTYNDLIEERQDTLKSILDLGHIPSGMEGFFAADEDQFEYIKKIIDECDYYLLIIAGRYGSTDETGISYTEKEYDYAANKGNTVLAFIHEDITRLPAAKVETDTSLRDRLEAFRRKVREKRLVSFWADRTQLKSNIIISLSKSFSEKPSVGWVRGDTVANEDILAQLNAFRNEVDRLKLENEELRAKLKPQIDNLAPLQTPFNIRYSFYDRSGNHKTNSQLTLSWVDIFKMIGPSFFNASSQMTIDLCIKRHIADNAGGNYPRSVNISQTDVKTIKIQMTAHNLLHGAQSTNGTMAEFMELTDLGRRLLLEVGAVKA